MPDPYEHQTADAQPTAKTLPGGQVDATVEQTPSAEDEPSLHPEMDAEVATGPPWPRLVAIDAAYRPPRLIRWPIVAGVVVLAGWVALNVAIQSVSSLPSSAAPRVFAASEAHFSATFPGTPRRLAQTANGVSILTYSSQLSGHGVAVAYVALPAGRTFHLDAGITGAASSVKGSKVQSRVALIYHGQPAEDGVITSPGGVIHIRVVAFGVSGYLLSGTGPTVASFRDDYNRLIDTFNSTSPVAPAAPTGAGTSTATGSLALEMILPPSGFTPIPSLTPPNGPVSAAAFDSANSANAVALHYLAGYQMIYSNAQVTQVVVDALYRFAGTSDAVAFLQQMTAGGVTGTDPALPGSVTFDAKTADKSGIYYHAAVANRANVVMWVEYDNGTKAQPALLRQLASKQYARLG